MKHRCAWCGNDMEDSIWRKLPFGFNSNRCMYCDHLNATQRNWFLLIIVILQVILSFIFGSYHNMLWLIIYLLSIVVTILVEGYLEDNSPYVRVLDTNQKEEELEEAVIGTYYIDWKINSKQLFKVFNSVIVFLCICDHTGKPMSQMLCIRVKKVPKIKKEYIITKIDERVPMEYITNCINKDPMTNIMLYDEKKAIGTAMLVTTERFTE